MGGLAPAQRLYLEQQRCRVTSTLAFAQASRNVGELTADLPRRRRRPSSYSSSGMREGGDRTASSAGHTTSEELEDHMTFSQQQSKLDERRRRMYCLGCSSAYLGSTPSFASASNTTPPPSDQSWWSEDFSSYHPPSSYDGARAGMGAGDSCSSSSSSSYAVGFPVLQSPEPSEPLSGHLLDGSWVLQERDREPAFFPAKVCLTESLKWQGGPFHECWALPLVVGGSFLPEKCRSKQPLLLPQDVPLPPTPLGGHLPQLQHSAGLCGLDPTRAYRLGDAPVRVLGVGQQSWVLRKLVLWKNVLYELELLPAEAFMMAPPLARQPPLGFVPLSGATVNVLRPGMLRVRAARTCGDDSRSCTVHLCSRDPEDALWWAQLLRAAADLDVDDMYEPVPDDDLRAGRSGLASTPSKVTLSSGKCAVVRRARRRWGCKGRNSGDCAIKVFDKATFFESVRSGGERPDALVREALAQAALTSVVSESSSPIVRLLSAFETRTTLVLEMELMSSQTLLDELTRAGTMDEREAALITRSLLEAVSICQAQGMAHRDVKLSNILLPRDAGASLADCSSTSHPVRLADFGMAGLEDEEGCLRGRCGTPGYVAPEIFALGKQEPYPNGKVDLYSVGVVAYTMIAGYEPFFGETNADIIEQNSAGHVMFHLSSWGKVSLSGQSFVASLLEADPGERMTLAQARQHPWILSAAHVSPVDSDSDSKDDLDETVNLDYHDDELA
jgi:calcium/calmodulin-dependent protein kinase I